MYTRLQIYIFVHVHGIFMHIHVHTCTMLIFTYLHMSCAQEALRRLQKGTGKRTPVKHELFSVCVCYGSLLLRPKGLRGPKMALLGSRALAGLSEARPGPFAGVQDPPWGPLEARVSCRGTMFKASWAKLQALGSMLELPWRSGDTS